MIWSASNRTHAIMATAFPASLIVASFGRNYSQVLFSASDTASSSDGHILDIAKQCVSSSHLAHVCAQDSDEDRFRPTWAYILQQTTAGIWLCILFVGLVLPITTVNDTH